MRTDGRGEPAESTIPVLHLPIDFVTDSTPLEPAGPVPAHRFGGRGSLSVTGCLAWILAVALTVYLGLSGGGYDIVVRSELGIVIWWFVLLGVLVGALPRARLGRRAWIAVALLAGFLLWSWVGLAWSHSHELTLDDVAQLSTYLGVFVLALCAADLGGARSLLGGVACGIAIVSAAAVLSKLEPSLFPVDTAAHFYATGRLSYPFDYADAVGEFAALGIPLLLYLATSARTLAGRACSAAGLPIVLLCLAMTVSRGGILAAFVGSVAFVALMPDRIPRLATLALAVVGIVVLMVALLGRAALRDQITAAPPSERHSMLLITLAVVVATGLIQAALTIVGRHLARPGWLRVSRRRAQAITAGIVLAVVIVIVVAFAGGTVATLWREFKQPNPSSHSNQYFRLLSLAGSHRYQYWQVALRAFRSAPLLGIGPGTFRFYWAQHQTLGEFVLNAHSLWFETAAETGIVGWLLLAGLFAYLVFGGAIRALRCGDQRRPAIAAATATVAAFCAAAAFDWVWQIGVIPMASLIAAAVIVAEMPLDPAPAAGDSSSANASAPWHRRVARSPLVRRGAVAVTAIVAICLIAIPLASTVAVRSSQAAARQGELATALTDASTAQQLEPGAATPRLQRALLLEQTGDVSAARAAIAQAIAREPDSAQLWLVASRIAIESDLPGEALRDYERARALDPKSPIFE